MIIDNKIVESVKESNKKNINIVIDRLIKTFFSEILSEKDVKLLNLTFSENPTQDVLDEFLKDYDIETVGGSKVILLSYFMKLHPQLNFTAYEQNRLKGLLNFYKFQNLKIISHYSKVGRELNKENIPFIILKGGAMRFLRPEFARTMSDIDILVPEQNFEQVKQISTDLGYDYQDCFHSIDLHPKGTEEGTVDIHQWIEMGTGKETSINKELFERATKQKVFNIEAYVPCYEDLFFLTLVNMAKNLREKSSPHAVLFALHDCKFFLEQKPDFNWNIVTQNAKKTKSEMQVGFAIKFINKIVPNLLPEDFSHEVMFEKAIQDYCKEVTFERYIFEPLQEYSRNMKIQDAFKTFNGILHYIKTKSTYKFYKKIRKDRQIIHLIYDIWAKAQ